MISTQTISRETSTLVKRSRDPFGEPPRKSLKLAAPVEDAHGLAASYQLLKNLVCMNIDFAIKHELTEGLKMHDKIFGKDWNTGMNLQWAWQYSIEELVKKYKKERSSGVMVYWFGETAEEREINMKVLNLMAYDRVACSKPYPKIVYTSLSSDWSLAAMFTLEDARELYEYWGPLNTDKTPCRGGLEELTCRAKALLNKYQARISKGGKNGPGHRKDSFFRFFSGLA